MAIKIGQVVSNDAQAALAKLVGMPLHKALAMRIKRNLKTLEPAIDAYWEQRRALHAEHGGEVDAQGRETKSPGDGYLPALKALHADTLDEIALAPIQASQLPDTIEPIILLALDWLIVDDLDDHPAAAA